VYNVRMKPRRPSPSPSARGATKDEPTPLDAVAAWALATLKGAAQAKMLRAKLDKQKPAAPVAHFKLDAVERRIFELAWAVERRVDVADVARAKGGLTVERLREWAGGDVDAALSLRCALRRHALVTVGAGAIAASDVVRLAPGLATRLDGTPEPEALWPGIARFVPSARGDVPIRVTQVLEELDPRVATVLTLDGCGRRETHELAAGLARRSARGVLVVDGELAREAPSPWLLMLCARREADLDGDAIVVAQSAALGENWRALVTPPVVAGVPLVLLADAEHARDPLPAPCLVRRLSLHAPAPPPSANAPVAEAPAEKPVVIDDGLDHVRQMAIRDAERALGIFRPPPPAKPIAPKPAPQAVTPTPTTAQPTTTAPPTTTPPTTAATTNPPPSAQPTTPPKPVTPSKPTVPPQKLKGELPEDRDAARALMMQRRAAAKAQRERGARVDASAATADAATTDAAANATADATTHAATDATTNAANAATANAANAAAANAANAAAVNAAPVASAPPVEGAPLPLAAEPSIDEMVRVCNTSPSSAQRIELIAKLRGIKQSAVVATLRHNAASQHPGVRAAAEQAMAMLFGPNWNATRPVAKPVQRAPSDDKDRGPPGGW
jgi:hypothetical protein